MCSGWKGSNQLSILEWEGYDNPEYWKGFAEKHPAVNVKFTTLEGDPESLSNRNLDLVYDYLNAIMTPEANAAIANDYGYGPANRQSIALMNTDVVSALGLDRPNLLSLMNMMRPLTREQLEEYADTWAYVRGEK